MKDTYRPIIKELQNILALFYLLVVGIGMLFSYQRYAQFDINIFDYADLFDFLIAPFSDFKILTFAFLSMVMVSLAFSLNMWWKKKYPNSYSRASFGMDKKSWFNIYNYTVLLIGFLAYLSMAAYLYGVISAEEIAKKKPISLRFSDDEVIKGKVIGKTKDVIFLVSKQKVKAIPITSLVKEIVVK